MRNLFLIFSFFLSFSCSAQATECDGYTNNGLEWNNIVFYGSSIISKNADVKVFSYTKLKDCQTNEDLTSEFFCLDLNNSYFCLPSTQVFKHLMNKL